ncbi:MAG: hypothetical protein ACKVVP_15970 [Chloroflexota bacterium]
MHAANLWSHWRPRPDWLARSVISGFSASVAMLFTFFVAFGLAQIIGAAMPNTGQGADVLRGWMYALTHNALLDTAGSSLYLAGVFHLLVGVGVALLYGFAVEPRLSGPGWRSGLVFALGPWLCSVLIILPLVGAGVFGIGLSAGPLPALGNLVLHVIYGVTLGTIYGPLGDRPADSFSAQGPRDTLEASGQIEGATAGGIVIGAALGFTIGVVLLSTSSDRFMMVPWAALMFGILVLGAALGGALGPLLRVR